MRLEKWARRVLAYWFWGATGNRDWQVELSEPVERLMMHGRAATAAYLTRNFHPTPRDSAEIVKVTWEGGASAFLLPKDSGNDRARGMAEFAALENTVNQRYRRTFPMHPLPALAWQKGLASADDLRCDARGIMNERASNK